MTPNSNNENEINVYCDWLTDNGCQNLADEIRFDSPNQDNFTNDSYFQYRANYVGGNSIIGDSIGQDNVLLGPIHAFAGTNLTSLGVGVGVAMTNVLPSKIGI